MVNVVVNDGFVVMMALMVVSNGFCGRLSWFMMAFVVVYDVCFNGG